MSKLKQPSAPIKILPHREKTFDYQYFNSLPLWERSVTEGSGIGQLFLLNYLKQEN